MKTKVVDRLEKMKGKRFLYHAKMQTVLNYQVNKDEVIIATDFQIKTIDIEKIDEELNQFLPVQDSVEVSMFRKNKTIPDLADIVMSNIKKIQEDKEYIPQAKAIHDGIKTLVNMAKLDLQMQKMKNG